MKSISSAANEDFRLWLQLLDSRGIKKHGQFILSGRKTVPEWVRAHPEQVELIICPADLALPDWLTTSGLKAVSLATPLFKQLDLSGTHYPLALGRLPNIPTADLMQAPEGLEISCALGDPANLGALLRSAEAFGVSRVILLQESAHPFHPKSLRASASSSLRVPLAYGPSIESLNRESDLEQWVALDMNGENINNYRWPKNVRILIGEEGRGLPAELPVKRLSIPMQSGIESLNASLAAGIALFSYRCQFPIKRA